MTHIRLSDRAQEGGGGVEPKGGVGRGYRSVPRWSDGFRLSGEPWEGWVKVSSRYDGVTKTSDGYGSLSRGGSRGFGEGVAPRVLGAVGPWVWGRSRV